MSLISLMSSISSISSISFDVFDFFDFSGVFDFFDFFDVLITRSKTLRHSKCCLRYMLNKSEQAHQKHVAYHVGESSGGDAAGLVLVQTCPSLELVPIESKHTLSKTMCSCCSMWSLLSDAFESVVIIHWRGVGPYSNSQLHSIFYVLLRSLEVCTLSLDSFFSSYPFPPIECCKEVRDLSVQNKHGFV